MRIGVDASCWANERGYGRFTRELLGAMVELAPEDTFVFFLDSAARAAFGLQGPNVRLAPVAVGVSATRGAASGSRRSILDLLRMTRAVARQRLDVFFSPSEYTYFPLPPRLAAVITIHDVIAEAHPRLTLPTHRDRMFWRWKLRLALRQARFVLTVSEYSRRAISARLGVAPSRIRVAGEAPAKAFRPTDAPEEILATAERVGLPAGAEWFVYVGGFNPHKRVESLVRAHAEVLRACPRRAPYLLLIGDVEGDVFYQNVAGIRRSIEEAGTLDRVIWTGFIPDEQLRHLHSGALALVLPSEMEGFGLPAIEAAACGAPVVATTESPLPELLEGGGIFVPPGDPQRLTDALRRMVEDEDARRAMGARARERAARLSWARGARAALDAVYEAAA